MPDPEGKLTPAQHEILEVVWRSGETGTTVTEIWESIAKGRNVTRTTVLNLVDRLEKRRWLKRRRKQGNYRYYATVGREETAGGLAEEFVNDFFGGAADELVMSLLGANKLNSDDVRRLRRLLDERLNDVGAEDDAAEDNNEATQP